MSRRLYFDWAATAPLRDEARAAWLECAGAEFGNAGSAHQWGRTAKAALTRARRTFASALGVERDDLFFTGNGSEANLLALHGAIAALPRERRHVLVSPIEHPSVLEPLETAARRGEIELEHLSVDRFGRVDPEILRGRCRPTTGLVSVQLANHEIGTLQPIAAIAATTRTHGALLHCDATQAIGKTLVTVPALGCDLLVISAHKFGGPRGVGVLARRRNVALTTPLSPGRQEQGLRGGTEDFASCVAAAAALTATLTEQVALASQLAELSALLCARLRERLDDVTFHSSETYGLPGLVNFSLPEVRGDWLVTALDQCDVAISHGSACASLASLPSPVLVAIGARERALHSIRVSMGRATTRDDIEDLVARVHAAVVKLRLP